MPVNCVTVIIYHVERTIQDHRRGSQTAGQTQSRQPGTRDHDATQHHHIDLVHMGPLNSCGEASSGSGGRNTTGLNSHSPPVLRLDLGIANGLGSQDPRGPAPLNRSDVGRLVQRLLQRVSKRTVRWNTALLTAHARSNNNSLVMIEVM